MKHILNTVKIGEGYIIEYWDDEKDFVCRHEIKYRKLEGKRTG